MDNDKNNYSATLLHAVQNGYVDVCRTVLDCGADVGIKSDEGMTPLHYAARNGNLALCDLLLEHCASVDVIDDYGHTPLHYAEKRGDEKLVGLLAKHKSKTVYVITVECHMYTYDNTGYGQCDWVKWDDEYAGTRVLRLCSHDVAATVLQRISMEEATSIGVWMRDYFGGDGEVRTTAIATPDSHRSSGKVRSAKSVYDDRAKVEISVRVAQFTLED